MDRNQVEIAGRLTRDPEIRYTTSGRTLAQLGIAVNNRRKGADGEWIKETTFLDVTLFGNQAEVAQKYLKTGDGVFIDGRLQLDTWEDKNTGAKRQALKVIGIRMSFVGGGTREGAQDERPRNADVDTTSRPTDPKVEPQGDFEDIPF
tara:strand:- start:35 stop:478 length:444 start_codon:yes stop_codon:yes gene_type:complete